ncbi:CheR family methyltransferase [Pseudoroseomonas wenyumeiae]
MTGPALLESMAAAQNGLGVLLGFAPSAVLLRRLDCAAALLPALQGQRPDIGHPGWAALIDAVTVQETRLFRHPALLEAVATEVLPALGAGGGTLRLVSAGCATGRKPSPWRCWHRGGIVGGGVGAGHLRPALKAAATASWPQGPLDPARDVPDRYRAGLEAAGGRLRPGGPLRAAVRFQRANLLDPPAGLLDGADLIMCRNVMIYLLPEARAALLERFATALRPGGALVLGPTDSAAAEGGLVPWRPGLTSVWRRP